MELNRLSSSMSLRIALITPIMSSIQISCINQHPIEAVKTSKVLVTAISPSGLRMLSNLDLPLQQEVDYLLQFEFVLQDVHLSIEGAPIWKKPSEGMYEYCVHWQLPPHQKVLLIRLLNEALISITPEQKRIHQIYRSLSTQKFGVDWNKYYSS